MSSDKPELTRRRCPLLFALISSELFVISLFRLPENLAFDRFAFCDSGANLTVQFLITHGYRPMFDFGYHYGLLPLLIGRIWFAIFGLNPIAYQGLMVTCGFAMAWSIATIATRLELGPIGLMLVFIAIGFAVQPSYPALAQALEAVLLGFALAQQSAGLWPSALALSIAAVFAKPSMGYMYSSLLIVLSTEEVHRYKAGVAAFVRIAMPAAITFFVLAVVLAIVFGARVLIWTIVPIQGLVNYHAMNFGFFTGSGSAWWRQPGLSWMIYFIDPSGFWIASTLFLIGAGISAARRLLSQSIRRELVALRRDQIVITCSALHLCFLVLFFGNKYSWIYYSYVLVVGVAAAADVDAPSRRAALGLCVLSLVGWTDVVFGINRWWNTMAPDSVTAGLWATQEERAEWGKVMTFTRGHDLTVLDTKGAAEILFTGFRPPVTLYLDPGLMNSLDIHRKLVQLSQSEVVVVPAIAGGCGGIPASTEFETTMKEFVPVWKGEYIEVFQRRGDTSDAIDSNHHELRRGGQ